MLETPFIIPVLDICTYNLPLIERVSKNNYSRTFIDYTKQSYLIIGHIFDILNNIYTYFIKKLNPNTQYIMPSAKSIGYTYILLISRDNNINIL